MLLSQSFKFIRKATALMLLPLLAWSCQLVTEDYDCESDISDANQYINIIISVSADNNSATRANPNGGEEGDGREKGIVTRENEVDGVTIIFYRNTNGINATPESAQATPIDFVAYYETTLDENYTPRTGVHYPDEVYYTTGDQEMPTRLQSDQQYHVIVVANADLTSQITVGDATVTNLATLREMTRTTVYKDTDSGVGTNATKFVMTSERDDVLTFNYSTYDKSQNRLTFIFENIHLERMAARIDLLTNGATYNETYDHSGYEYAIEGSTDHFVLTSVMPFNVNNDGEYLIKRTNDDTAPYLRDETTQNWVLDPNTSSKTASSHPNYLSNTLTDVIGMTSSLNVTMSGQQDYKTSIQGRDNIIVGYVKENTISTATPYYYYATGLAFEGYYYRNGAKINGERRVYYHFIRHQGEKSTAYDALTAAELATFDKTTTIGNEGTPMNYGIVRNNIYRISIGSINSENGSIKIKIEEEKWRHVDNPTIYI
ncbi:MAG: hypothetical protein IJ887_09465 [Prevotella sp.]|nr:hypothetical protein [Prevotella sp.]